MSGHRVFDWDDERHPRNLKKLQEQWGPAHESRQELIARLRREWNMPASAAAAVSEVAPTVQESARTIDLPTLCLRADVTNVGNREVDVRFASETPVARYDFSTGTTFDEVLSMDPRHVRLERLNGGAPVLAAHRQDSLDCLLGVVVEGSVHVSIAAGARAKLRFSKRADVEPFYQDVVDGILTNVSVGYRVYKYQETKSATGRATWTAIDWEPYEISMVPIPADAKAGVGRATVARMAAAG